MADRPIGFWLRLVDNLIQEQFSKTLDEHGVTRIQWQLLNVLAGGPHTIVELDSGARVLLATAPGTTSADHLAELVESGWVDVTEGIFELTDRGRAARDRLSTVVATQRTDMSSGVTDDDRAVTMRTLERVARNLGWTDEN